MLKSSSISRGPEAAALLRSQPGRRATQPIVEGSPVATRRRSTGPPASNRRVLAELLEASLPRLSPAQRRVAECVLRNYQDVAFMGVAELAKAAGVSPAAVVRFATSLQFDGYPGFQRTLHGIIRSELRQGERFAASLDGESAEPLEEHILAQESQNLATLRANLDRAALKTASRQVRAARGVNVVGFRASATLAHYVWYNLRKIKADVRLYTNPGSVTTEEIALSDPGTLVILITFPRYSRELLDVADFVHKKKFPTMGLTNNELSPLVPLCHRSLLVEVGEISFTDFYAAPLALVNALVAGVARDLRQGALGRLNRLDDLAAAQGYLSPGGRRRRDR